MKRQDKMPIVFGHDFLGDVVRTGMEQLLNLTMMAEFDTCLASSERAHGRAVLEASRTMRSWILQTGVGPVELRRPDIIDRRQLGKTPPFDSVVAPRRMRTKLSYGHYLAWKYIQALEDGDFTECRELLLGGCYPVAPMAFYPRLKSVFDGVSAAYQAGEHLPGNVILIWLDSVNFHYTSVKKTNRLLVACGLTDSGRVDLMASSMAKVEDRDGWMDLFLRMKSLGVQALPGLVTGVHDSASASALKKVYEDYAPVALEPRRIGEGIKLFPAKLRDTISLSLQEIIHTGRPQLANQHLANFVRIYGREHHVAMKALFANQPFEAITPLRSWTERIAERCLAKGEAVANAAVEIAPAASLVALDEAISLLELEIAQTLESARLGEAINSAARTALLAAGLITPKIAADMRAKRLELDLSEAEREWTGVVLKIIPIKKAGFDSHTIAAMRAVKTVMRAMVVGAMKSGDPDGELAGLCHLIINKDFIEQTLDDLMAKDAADKPEEKSAKTSFNKVVEIMKKLDLMAAEAAPVWAVIRAAAKIESKLSERGSLAPAPKTPKKTSTKANQNESPILKRRPGANNIGSGSPLAPVLAGKELRTEPGLTFESVIDPASRQFLESKAGTIADPASESLQAKASKIGDPAGSSASPPDQDAFWAAAIEALRGMGVFEDPEETGSTSGLAPVEADSIPSALDGLADGPNSRGEDEALIIESLDAQDPAAPPDQPEPINPSSSTGQIEPDFSESPMARNAPSLESESDGFKAAQSEPANLAAPLESESGGFQAAQSEPANPAPSMEDESRSLLSEPTQQDEIRTMDDAQAALLANRPVPLFTLHRLLGGDLESIWNWLWRVGDLKERAARESSKDAGEDAAGLPSGHDDPIPAPGAETAETAKPGRDRMAGATNDSASASQVEREPEMAPPCSGEDAFDAPEDCQRILGRNVERKLARFKPAKEAVEEGSGHQNHFSQGGRGAMPIAGASKDRGFKALQSQEVETAGIKANPARKIEEFEELEDFADLAALNGDTDNVEKALLAAINDYETIPEDYAPSEEEEDRLVSESRQAERAAIIETKRSMDFGEWFHETIERYHLWSTPCALEKPWVMALDKAKQLFLLGRPVPLKSLAELLGSDGVGFELWMGRMRALDSILPPMGDNPRARYVYLSGEDGEPILGHPVRLIPKASDIVAVESDVKYMIKVLELYADHYQPVKPPKVDLVKRWVETKAQAGQKDAPPEFDLTRAMAGDKDAAPSWCSLDSLVYASAPGKPEPMAELDANRPEKPEDDPDSEPNRFTGDLGRLITGRRSEAVIEKIRQTLAMSEEDGDLLSSLAGEFLSAKSSRTFQEMRRLSVDLANEIRERLRQEDEAYGVSASGPDALEKGLKEGSLARDLAGRELDEEGQDLLRNEPLAASLGSSLEISLLGTKHLVLINDPSHGGIPSRRVLGVIILENDAQEDGDDLPPCPGQMSASNPDPMSASDFDSLRKAIKAAEKNRLPLPIKELESFLRREAKKLGFRVRTAWDVVACDLWTTERVIKDGGEGEDQS